MTTHTLTITLTDEQYQMLVAQTHYENYFHLDGDPVTAAGLAAGILTRTLEESRAKNKKQFDKRFDELQKERDALEEDLPEASGDPGMHSDVINALDQNDNQYQALVEEWDAFLGPRPTPTP
jgi:hypothetical protein